MSNIDDEFSANLAKMAKEMPPANGAIIIMILEE